MLPATTACSMPLRLRIGVQVFIAKIPGALKESDVEPVFAQLGTVVSVVLFRSSPQDVFNKVTGACCSQVLHCSTYIPLMSSLLKWLSISGECQCRIPIHKPTTQHAPAVLTNTP